ncbi:MAG: SpoIIE family protein phosphatase [Candidatus Krumholzibacteriia bacterium]
MTRLLGLWALGPLLLVAALASGLQLAQKPELGASIRRLEVVAVDAGGPAERAGLRRGDRLRAVGDSPLHRMVDWDRLRATDWSLDPLHLTVARAGTLHRIVLVPQPPSRAALVRSYSLWLTGVAFLLMGWWVLSKRGDPVARNFFAASLIFAYILLDVPDLPSSAYIIAKEIGSDVLQLMLPVFFLRFLLLFPSVGSRPREDGRLLRWILVPPLPLLALVALVHLLTPSRAPEALVAVTRTGALVLFMLYFVAGLAVFARKAWRRDRPIQHTKMRVILVGLLAGLGPFLFGTLLAGVAPAGGGLPWEYLGFSLLLVPAAFGVAIMRYGALDTAFVVRTSLVYGTLTLLVLVGYVIVVGVVGHALAQALRLSTYPLVLALVAASGLAVLPLRRAAQRWVDRAFYPARLATRAAVVQLAHDLTGIIDRAEAVELLLDRLELLYAPGKLHIFLARDGGAQLEPAGRRPRDRAQGGPPGLPPLATGARLARLLDDLRRPVFVEELEDLLLPGGTGISAAVLDALDSELLVPLVTGNRLVGFLSLGPKRGGALYSQEDLANLRTLAIQTAASLENQRLYRESSDREQIERELSLARDIQTQLLPDGPLERPGVAICGRNDPCHAVGGDYFDYFRLGDDAVGVCIADVSGKGIAAAMLMSTVRASFRSLAVPAEEPEAVVRALNRNVTDLLAPGPFVSFFFGVYRPASGLLAYCNAGMDPPLLLRSDGRVERLRRGGPVLGVLPNHEYRRGTVRLRPSDLLVLYTDGITEQHDPAGVFYDERRLLRSLRDAIAPVASAATSGEPAATSASSLSGAPAAATTIPAPAGDAVATLVADDPPEIGLEDLLGKIFAAVTAFGGAERSDDRTVILLRASDF